MIVALVGSSACGKTTHAEFAARELGIPVRHCGNEVREAAAAKGLTIDTCGDDIHRQVDKETIDWCRNLGSSLGIVEGRFLDHVLTGVPGVAFVQVTAPEGERARRLAERMARPVNEQEVQRIDHEDDLFRGRMYFPSAVAPKMFVIDTGGGPAPECVQNLISLMQSMVERERG